MNRAGGSPFHPGLLIKFGEYGPPNRWRTLRGIILEPLTQDAAMMKERLEWELARQSGLVTPRLSHTTFSINDTPYGLYTLDERVDRSFLTHRFSDDRENLYRDNYDWATTFAYEWRGGDWRTYVPRLFEPVNNEDPHDGTALVAYLNDVNFATAEGFEGDVGRRLDWTNFLRTIALEHACGEEDGITGDWGVHNYFMAMVPGLRKFQYVMWDRDYSFVSPTRTIWFDRDIYMDMRQNVLLRRTYDTPALRARFLTSLGDCLSRWVNERWLVDRVNAIYSQIRDAAYADTHKPYSNQKPALAVLAVVAALSARASAQDRSDEVFDETRVNTFRVTIDPALWQEIVDAPRDDERWRRADHLVGEGTELVTLVNVGLRPHGNTRMPGHPKPSFRVKTNEYVSGQALLGLRQWHFDFLAFDASMLREWHEYLIQNARGVAAPRYAYARVYVNGDYVGLYGVEEWWASRNVQRRWGRETAQFYRFLGNPANLAAYRAKIRALIDGVHATAAVQARMDAMFARIRPHAFEDRYKPYSNDDMLADFARVRQFVADRNASLDRQLR